MIASVPALSERDLHADVVATYPGIVARPLRGSGASGWVDVHAAFLAWLDNCGWYVDNYAGAVEETPR